MFFHVAAYIFFSAQLPFPVSYLHRTFRHHACPKFLTNPFDYLLIFLKIADLQTVSNLKHSVVSVCSGLSV